MRDILTPVGCKSGRFTLVADSARTEKEWRRFCRVEAENSIRAYDRLTSDPLTRYPGRQNPLRGKQNKPFWELEAGAAYRIIYAVDVEGMTIMIAVVNDAHSGAQVGKIVTVRGDTAREFELVDEV